MKTRTLANTPPPASGFALYHEGGNIRALDANGKVHRLRPERGTPVHAAAATATLDPTGADNSVTWTAAAAGLAGNDISVTYATPAASAETVVAASGNDVTVTPGTKARMVVTGMMTSDGSTPVTLPTLFFDGYGDEEYVSYYSPEEYATIVYDLTSSKWVIDYYGAQWESEDQVGFPDLCTTWTPVSPATGTPIVTAGVSSAQQVIDASALSFVTPTASGTVTGAVAAVARTVLTGGVDATEGAAGDQLFDDDNIYLAIADVRKSSTSGWITEPYPS